MIRISIVIVTYNSEETIKRCLESLFCQDLSGCEIIIIDNASSDNTLDIIKGCKEVFTLRVNSGNEGFSAAVNSAIEISRGDYVLTLNPDVILSQDFISSVRDRLKNAGRDIGMIGVKILRQEKRNEIDSTGLILSRAVRFFDRGFGKKDIGQYDGINGILGPCAAAALYRRRMLDDIKLKGEYFDEDFFYLIEDFDIALRARNKGWKVLYMPDVICYHLRNGSHTAYAYRQHMSFRNRYLLIIKDLNIKPEFILYFIFYDIPRFLFMLLTNKYTLRGLREVIILNGRMLEKRRAIRSAD